MALGWLKAAATVENLPKLLAILLLTTLTTLLIAITFSRTPPLLRTGSVIKLQLRTSWVIPLRLLLSCVRTKREDTSLLTTILVGRRNKLCTDKTLSKTLRVLKIHRHRTTLVAGVRVCIRPKVRRIAEPGEMSINLPATTELVSRDGQVSNLLKLV